MTTRVRWGLGLSGTRSFLTDIAAAAAAPSVAALLHSRRFSRRMFRASLLHLFDHRVRKFCRASLAAHVSGQLVPCAVDLLQSVANLQSGLRFADVTKHEQGRAHDRSRVGNVLSGDVGSRSVHCLEDRALMPEICARNQAQSPD